MSQTTIDDLRQQIQQLEAECAARERTLFDLSFDGLVIHENGLILDVNQTYEQMMGYTRDELKGMSVLELVNPLYHDLVSERIQIPTNILTTEILARHKDGHHIHQKFMGRDFVYEGRPVRVAVVRDITEDRHQRERDARQRIVAEALRATAAALNSSLDIDAVMRNILESVGRLVPYDTVDIMLVEGEQARVKFWRGYPKEYDDYFQAFALSIHEPSVMREMYDSHKPAVIGDTELYSGWVKYEETAWIRSFAGAPILLDEKVIGFINLDSATPNAFNEDHAEILQTFASQAAVAIENARLYQEARQQAANAEALRESAAALNSTLDANEIMTTILRYVGHVVPHDAVNIMLVEGDSVRFSHWRGYTPQHDLFLQNFRLKITDTANIREMIQTRQPMAIPNTAQYPGWVVVEETSWVRSYASAPIISGGLVIGFINLDSATPNALTLAHARLLQAFADQAGSALRNATLYEQARQQAADLERRNLLLETLNELSRSSIHRLEVGHVMDAVARLTAQAVDATSAFVCDWSGRTGYATVLAEYISEGAAEAGRASELGQVYKLDKEFADPHSWLHFPYGYRLLDVNAPDANPEELANLREFGGKVALSVPLIVQGKPLGFLEVWDSRSLREFKKEEIEVVQAIARQVSTTIDKARLLSALQESENRNRAMINAIPDSIFRLGRDGTYLDAKLLSGSRFKPEDIIGKRLKDTMPPEVAARGQYYINKALDQRTLHVFEYQLPEADGTHDYEARLVVYSEEEVLAIIRDITERKRAEYELAKARDQALEASRTKSQFLANMSHELRTPLNSIINYTQLTLDGIYGNLTRTQMDRLEKVVRNGRNLLALINDVLDLSKIEAGQMTLRRRQVNTLDMISGVLEIFRPMAEEKKLHLSYEGGDVLDIFVDETRARQVITNIVGNAIKFTPEGSVTISTHKDEDQMLRFSITDTGIGIPPHALDLIFEEFRQVDNTSTREYEGTGLGLTISRRIVAMHGGKITVESEVGVGSTFHVYFPLA